MRRGFKVRFLVLTGLETRYHARMGALSIARGWYIGGCVAVFVAIGSGLAGCTEKQDDSVSTRTTTSVTSSTSAAPGAWGIRPAPTTGPPNVDQEAIDRLDAAYLDDDASDRVYWQRVVELLSAQDDVVLDPEGDVLVTVVHEGESVTLYRSDLDSIAFNSCSEVAHGEDPADTVGWIMDAFELQRRWEAAQIRLAALEAKCPTLGN